MVVMIMNEGVDPFRPVSNLECGTNLVMLKCSIIYAVNIYTIYDEDKKTRNLSIGYGRPIKYW